MSEIKLMQGDCLELMKTIPDKSIDMVLTDPPYGTTSNKWDSVIPFKPMWEQLNRIIKDNGNILLFGSGKFAIKLSLSNEDDFKYFLYWIKSRPFGCLQCANKPMDVVENILVFSKGVIGHKSLCKNRMTYNPQGIIYNGKKIVSENFAKNRSPTLGGPKPNQIGAEYECYSNYPNNILKFDSVSKTLHTTQKPVALLEYLIKTYSNENETVLDFTMGSGSTGVACKNLNRNFIGFELDEKYFDIAKQRIENGFYRKEINDDELKQFPLLNI